MTGKENTRHRDLLNELSRETRVLVICSAPESEWDSLANELVIGYDYQQKSGQHPNETLIQYAEGCIQHRFKKLAV